MPVPCWGPDQVACTWAPTQWLGDREDCAHKAEASTPPRDGEDADLQTTSTDVGEGDEPVWQAQKGHNRPHLCTSPVRPPNLVPLHPLALSTWMPFSCRFRYRVLTGMLAGTSASSLRVQITRLAWLLQEQASGQEVAGGEPPAAADVMATPPPPAPR
ncbi:hypothetical protein P7K49_034897, partial [Saguinus oedipus]